MRRSGSAGRQAAVPALRKRTSTLALRLASPSIAHSNPRFSSVGCSTWNRLAFVAFWAARVLAEIRIRAATRMVKIVHHRPQARCSATRASRRVESSTGSGEFDSWMISGISVHPSIGLAPQDLGLYEELSARYDRVAALISHT